MKKNNLGSNCTDQVHTFAKPIISALSAVFLTTACMSTTPSMGGGSSGAVSGGAGGASASNNNAQLESCDETLGTLSVFEDTSLPWWSEYRRTYPKLGSTIPVIRLMIQQSNCFVIVERGRAMNAMNTERQLMQTGQLRAGSNIGGGQMVAADYTLSPSVLFAEKTQGGKAIAGALFGTLGSIVGGGFSKNEAATSLLLIDNRSGVQVSSSTGSAANHDFSLFGGMFAGPAAGGAGGFSKTPEGKMLVTAFADSYNQMVVALRSYKAQEVEGGLGKGGRLTVGGADDPMPDATDAPAITTSTTTTAVYVDNTPSRVTVSDRRSYNFDVDEYDEKAFNRYYDWLKNYGPLMTAFVSFDPENNNPNWPGGMSMAAAATMLLTQLDSHRIELEAWPYEARVQAWRKMGKRLESHTELFERNRTLALRNEKLDDEVRQVIESIQVVTKESLFPEGI